MPPFGTAITVIVAMPSSFVFSSTFPRSILVTVTFVVPISTPALALVVTVVVAMTALSPSLVLVFVLLLPPHLSFSAFQRAQLFP